MQDSFITKKIRNSYARFIHYKNILLRKIHSLQRHSFYARLIHYKENEPQTNKNNRQEKCINTCNANICSTPPSIQRNVYSYMHTHSQMPTHTCACVHTHTHTHSHIQSHVHTHTHKLSHYM
jgi:hypothetical protein